MLTLFDCIRNLTESFHDPYFFFSVFKKPYYIFIYLSEVILLDNYSNFLSFCPRGPLLTVSRRKKSIVNGDKNKLSFPDFKPTLVRPFFFFINLHILLTSLEFVCSKKRFVMALGLGFLSFVDFIMEVFV